MPNPTIRTVRSSRAAITNTIAIAVAAAVVAPTATAFAATDMFLELGPVKGESADRLAGGKVQLSSFTFSASRKGWDGTIKGNPRTGASDSSAGAGAEKVNMQDMSVMRGPRQTTSQDGSVVAADTAVASPRDSASGMPTGKRQHSPVTFSKPLDRGSVTVAGNLPGCKVGAAYADAVLQTPTERFEFKDAIITDCTMSGSTGGDDRPTESVSLNYDKVIVRGWNPEKKEE